MRKRVSLVAALFSAVMLTSCGGDDEPVIGATSDATVAMNAQNGANTASSLVNEVFTFAGGVPDFGTSTSTSFQFTNSGATPPFRITSAANLAVGTTEFGSCRFRVVTSSFPADSLLGAGKTVTIPNCVLKVRTRGQSAGTTQDTEATLTFGTVESGTTTVTVVVSATGVVTVNNVVVTTVTIADLTGG